MPAAGALRVSGADSQCALTMSTARGLGSDCDQRDRLGDPGRVVEQRRGAVAEVERRHRPVVRRPGALGAGGGGDVAQERVEGGTRCVRVDGGHDVLLETSTFK
ncbi:hypothetical protein GCM10025868_30490 [Angustibacter aerolatus]|uniref:Uncharacterized protein n=1 Tax=Angustibacter aerolatus TaxID=1162965 RepID=A0ABQ6JKY0_9ACTN|nr:hypothetical protein GCM10025868_30490 [Angustibacter aerolatus]